MDSKRTKSRKHLFLPGLLDRTRRTFDKIKDSINPRTAINLTDCLMSGLAMFGLKYPSLLQFETQTRNKNSPVTHNLRTLYGIQQIPSDTYLRERLDEINPMELQKPINRIISQLQRGKILDLYKYYDDHCFIALDASGYFSSQQVHCENCCEKHHKNGTITFYHQTLAAVIINPSYRTVFPMMIEPIKKQDGNKKNDCEHSSAKRLLENLRKAHPHLKMVIVMDGLYADSVIIRLLKKLKFSFIITAKENDLKYLFEFYCATTRKEKTENNGKINRTYRYANQLPLNDKNSEIEVNILECIEETKRKKTRFCWITDLILNDKNVSTISKGGRARWKVENETFNTLKNQGYQFEHNFGHGDKNLNVVFAYLMFTAFLIDQIQEFSCKYFKAALKIMSSTRKYLWEKIRIMFFEYFIDTWDQLYAGIIDGIKPIRLGEVIQNTS
jgi:hypothetical protein